MNKKIYNDRDILSPGYYDYGSGTDSFKKQLKFWNDHTGNRKLDFEDMVVMSITGIEGNTIFAESKSLNLEDVEVETEKFSIDCPRCIRGLVLDEQDFIFYFGGVFSHSLDIRDDNLFFVKKDSKTLLYKINNRMNQSMKRLSGKLNAFNIQNMINAEEYSEDDPDDKDDLVLNAFYREYEGVKYICSVFTSFPSFYNESLYDNFLKSCHEIDDCEVVLWTYTQEFRTAYVEFHKSPEIEINDSIYVPGIVFMVSDTGYCSPLLLNVWRNIEAPEMNYIIQEQIKYGRNSAGEKATMSEIVKEIYSSQMQTAWNLNTGMKTFAVPTINNKNLISTYKTAFFKDMQAVQNMQNATFYSDLIMDERISEKDIMNPVSKIRMFCGQVLNQAV